MNEYDSAKIVDILVAKLGFEQTTNPAIADFILLNTCSVRAKAEEKLFSDLGRFRKFKAKNPRLIIAVGGCVAVQEKTKIMQRSHIVDLVFGPQTLHRLPQMYQAVIKTEQKIVNIDAPGIEKFDYFPEPKTLGPVAFVSIMEGCNKFCSYCIVPYTRGREVSRPAIDIIKESKILAKNGVKEIVLLGQNVNAYQEKLANGTINFAALIRMVATITEIARIRYFTSHPAEFTDELIDLYRTEPKLVDHLHLPIQSGSNKILQAMHRGYTTEDYQEIITKLRMIRPNISIASDFIVGFPGETQEDFQTTMNLITKVQFDHSFSFIYSPRPNTPATKLIDNVTLTEKKQRLALMQNQIMLHTIKISKAMVGTIQQILVAGSAKKDPQQLSGRTSNNRVINFSGAKHLIGKIVEVKITEALPYSLRGTLVTS